MNTLFRKLSRKVSEAIGSPWAFMIALGITLLWLVTGPIFHWSDTWQLIMNTLTSVGTFLIAFLIQNTQNRDSKEIHLKLDELIRASERARNRMVDLEEMTDEELDALYGEFKRLRQQRDVEHIRPVERSLV